MGLKFHNIENFKPFIWQKQEVGDVLGVSVLYLLAEIMTLPNLVAINLVKKEVQIFQIAT